MGFVCVCVCVCTYQIFQVCFEDSCQGLEFTEPSAVVTCWVLIDGCIVECCHIAHVVVKESESLLVSHNPLKILQGRKKKRYLSLWCVVVGLALVCFSYHTSNLHWFRDEGFHPILGQFSSQQSRVTFVQALRSENFRSVYL